VLTTEAVRDLPTFGRYRATAELGAGGMGTVYRAYDDRLRREVAIKTILLERTGQESLDRFFHEARAVGALAHPNIVAVYDMDVAEGTPYLVLELAPGGSLKQRIASGTLDAATVRSVGIQIALALEAAHARGILHRDVKPANILETEPGTFKLADFGIAKLPDSTLTMTGMFLGSPAYAAPESIGCGQFSPASDVYSLGATLHELLAGEPPYGRGAGLASIIAKAVEEGPPSLAQNPGVPPDLADMIRSALATDPAARPNAAAFAHALATGPATTTRTDSTRNSVAAAPVAVSGSFTAPMTTGERRKRTRLIVGVLATLLLIGVIAATSGSGNAPDVSAAGATVSPASGLGEAPLEADDEGENEPEIVPPDERVYGNALDGGDATSDDRPPGWRGKGKKKGKRRKHGR
jgi:eukaryotic-like serine/threonine-protein kinase